MTDYYNHYNIEIIKDYCYYKISKFTNKNVKITYNTFPMGPIKFFISVIN